MSEKNQRTDPQWTYRPFQPNPYSEVPSPQTEQNPLQQTRWHHHTLPTSSTLPLAGEYIPVFEQEDGPYECMVGKPGFPSPILGVVVGSPISAEEEELLIRLKENYDLSWRQIGDFFPTRKNGTLQVRYSTKLAPRRRNWTEENVCYLLILL